MDITKLSTKGQVVIPERVRRGLQSGTPFLVSRRGRLIVLKQVADLTKREERELCELSAIWDEVDSGAGKTYAAGDFVAAMKEW